jgi:hypothetical protein
MELNIGDWIKTASGDVGTIAHICQVNKAYINIGLGSSKYLTVAALDELTKIDRPTEAIDRVTTQ